MIRFTLALLLTSAFAFAAPDNDWGTFRGPNRDGISPDTGLLKAWPAGGPPLLWKTKGIGLGATNVSITGNTIFTTGDFGGSCHLIALNSADGKQIWATKMGPVYVDPHPWLHGPRATPSTDGSLVIATNPQGEVICAEVATGKQIWTKHLKEFSVDTKGELAVGMWLYCDSPLIDGENVVFVCGGTKGSVLALKKATGEFAWQSAELKDKAEYTSLFPAEIGGKRQYIVLTQQTLAGISASDGKVLWKIGRKGAVAVIPTPIYKDGYIFVTSGYKIGCNVFKITSEGGAYKVEEVYSDDKADVKVPERTANHHGGMILIGDHVYGTNETNFRCVEFKTGKLVWENKSVGKGAIAYADGHFVLRSETKKKSEIALIEATPEGYKETGRFTQPDQSGEMAWPHPVIFGGKMYIRDHDVLLCYDVKAK